MCGCVLLINFFFFLLDFYYLCVALTLWAPLTHRNSKPGKAWVPQVCKANRFSSKQIN